MTGEQEALRALQEALERLRAAEARVATLERLLEAARPLPPAISEERLARFRAWLHTARPGPGRR